MAILDPKSCTPRCTATVELLSKVFRPFLFMVTVVGLPPHAQTRRYKVAADTDNSAAIKGLELFVREFSSRELQIATAGATITPKAKLQ